MIKRFLLITLVALAALLLASCKTSISTVINSDQSGSAGIEIGFTAQEAALLQLSSGDTTGLCTLMAAEMDQLPGMIIDEEQRGDETWCIFSYPFNDLEELTTLYEQQFDVDVQRLEMTEDNQFFYDVSMDMTNADTAEISSLGLLLDLSWTLIVPGSVGSHNADEVRGQTLTWELTPGQIQRFQAESSSSSSWTLWLIIIGSVCLGSLVLAAVGVIVYFVVRRKNK